ncbi:hypothetical protein M5K25_021501 [Dendrobium thyrsiflorum]|uniref:Late embryogenesis abundant protein LEA-2 subgroup domain-containing protein n=1 Tax=Dendrobium thyrsiflorum TaxID=117978 RepID=A0ABD0UJI5_DENTH
MADKHQINQEDYAPSATIHPTSRTQRWRSSFNNLQNHRFTLYLSGILAATVLLAGLVILILAFTLFKIKDPQLIMNSLHIDRLLVPGLVPSLTNPFSLNATLTADISIKNPNAASFRFRNSTTDFYYGGEIVGVAYAPEGRVRARRTLRMNVTVDVLADRVVMETNATGVVLGEGRVNITSFTDVFGRVDLLGVYKRNLDILLNCSFTIGFSGGGFVNKVCQGNVL